MLEEKLRNMIENYLLIEFTKTPGEASIYEVHAAIAKSVIGLQAENIKKSIKLSDSKKKAYYLSAEFLMGRIVNNNLLALGLTDTIEKILSEYGYSMQDLEEIEDAALGNGGLGRLAACFLDSAATHQIPLNGYGIRYKYGLFEQKFEKGFQKEFADDWTKHGDPWSIRREDEAIQVKFADQTVMAVPYDMPIFGYGSNYVGNLRLWQSEALEDFNIDLFNKDQYNASVEEKNRAEDISRVLYPNDSSESGKILRLKQQYFFCSASMKDLFRKYVNKHGRDFSNFPEHYAVQINDTHPVIAIPELIRILIRTYNLSFVNAFNIARQVFSYTNHTVMAEALEVWDIKLFKKVIPKLYDIILMINESLIRELSSKRVSIGKIRDMKIASNTSIQMARLAVYATHCTNGVAEIHTEILKNYLFKDWVNIYPDRIQNKTNGITQRRWLALCNPELSEFVTKLTGNNDWVTDLRKIKECEKFANDKDVLKEFSDIKYKKKVQLCEYIKRKEGIELNPNFIFDIQIKRLHEYKRQLLNAFSILDIYYGIKEGRIKDFYPTAYIFGAKSAPGYQRAKGIIKYINEVAKLINSDPEVNDLLKVVFVQNYNVSYAEKLIPAADISEQISAAGNEASGTGNMKLMLNGAVTLGTYDGANIEIIKEAGKENNYIFGGTVEEFAKIKDLYDPQKLYKENPRISRILDTLVDGTFTDNKTGIFDEVYKSVLYGASWHSADNYFLLYDFESYVDAKLQANSDYRDNKLNFAKKAFLNMANAGKFSSDRTIIQYAEEIWNIK